MNWEYYLRASLELAIIFPSAVLCFLPVQDHIRVRRWFLFLWGGLLLGVWTFLGGWVLAVFHWHSNAWLLPSVPLFLFLYCRLVELSLWKTISVALGVCSTFSCVTNLAAAIEAYFFPLHNEPWFPLLGGLVYNFLYWALVAGVWHSATHAARGLINDWEMPRTWYFFWVLPVGVMGVNLYIHSIDIRAFTGETIILLYIVVSVALLAMLLFTYGMFYIVAKKLTANLRLQRENDFLQFQVSRYEALRKSIEESRRVHHDLRQHLKVVQECVAAGDMDTLTDYLKKYDQAIPTDLGRNYCDNYAVNALLRYYGEQAEALGVEMEVSFQAGKETVIPEPEFCALLGNLLENALDACAGASGQRYIQVMARQTGDSVLSLTVDNTSPVPPVVENGRLQSSKRGGSGTGTESVRIIAERYHGDARFQWQDGMFYASVLLNP